MIIDTLGDIGGSYINIHVTVSTFARYAGLTLFSARKQLEAWTKGDNPKLMLSKMGHIHIYTEI